MKLSEIKREDVIEAGEFIDVNGIPNNYVSNQYYVELPNGREYPFKYLIRIAYQMTDGNAGKWLEFQSNETYRNYVKHQLGLSINYYKEGVNFFTNHDIDYFHSIANKKIKNINEDSKTIKDRLTSLLFKTDIWTKNVLPIGYSHKFRYRWQFSGTLDSYFWARIFKEEWYNKGIFFTIGVTGEGKGLFFKLDCQFKGNQRSNSLTIQQQDKFRKLLALYDCKDRFIGSEDLKNYDWDSLIALTNSYIQDYLELYEEAVAHVWDLDIQKNVKPINTLNFTEAPKKTIKGKRTINRIKYSPDWEILNRYRKKLGDAGEQLIIEIEKEKLRKAGRNDLEQKVYKVPDSDGYDIHSVTTDDDDMFIEVKTTSLSKGTDFYLTINEIEVSEIHHAQYYLYRIYNFDSVYNSGDCYILKGKLRDHLTLEPICFKASISG